jgi:beta-xylosidase
MNEKSIYSSPMPIPKPVLRGFHPDPSICRVGDDYYQTPHTPRHPSRF